MEYSNYAQVEFVCKKIAENEKLLSDLLAADEVRLQMSSGYHIKTIQCGIKCEPDYALDLLAKQFKRAVISEVEKTIELLKNELKPL